MGVSTGIEWTDATWNPVRGCSRVSEGCRHCYAETVAARFSGPGLPYEGLAKRVGGEARWTGKVRLVPEHLGDPLRWKKPRRIFVNSMSDLFHEGLTFEEIAAVFGVMAASPRHVFQVLTKRPQRALEFFAWIVSHAGPGDGWGGPEFAREHGIKTEWMGVREESRPAWNARSWAEPLVGRLDIVEADRHGWPLRNVWLGVSVEDQSTADERIPLLLQCPAAVRFVSYEPALGPVDFTELEQLAPGALGEHSPGVWLDALRGHLLGPDDMLEARLDWVIVGGESGPGARPFDVAWARSTIEQCRATSVPVFVKQMGRWVIGDNEGFGCVQVWLFDDGSAWVPPLIGFGAFDRPPGAVGFQLTDRKGGDWRDWPADLRVREFPWRGSAMTLPITYLDAVVTAAKAARDFDARPLTQVEQARIATLYRTGYSAEQAAEYLTRGVVTVRRGPWGDGDESGRCA